MRRTLSTLAVVLSLLPVLCFSAPATTTTAGPATRQVVEKMVAALFPDAKSPAVVVAVVTPGSTTYFTHGQLSRTNPASPDEKTLFEVGSITKVFTAITLADMASRGEVRLSDPVRRYLPPSVHLSTKNGKEITLEHLATHTSGLPRVPLVLFFKGFDDPYATEDTARLYAVLDGMYLFSEPGKTVNYSNLGFAVLGQALCNRAHLDYATLVRQRVCEPLGLSDTRVNLTPEQERRLAPGQRDGEVVSSWHLNAYAPCGGLKSTAADMSRFLRLNMGLEKSPLDAVLAEARRPRVPMGGVPAGKLGLAWINMPIGGHPAVWHNGGTGGYSSFIGFLQDRPVGVVVLVNTAGADAETALGIGLLDRLGKGD